MLLLQMLLVTLHHYCVNTEMHYVTSDLKIVISVCLCDTRVLCIKMSKRFIKILLPPDNPIILVFVIEGHCLTLSSSPLMEASSTGRVSDV